MTEITGTNPTSALPLENPIIACVDFSEDSKAALIWACEFAGCNERPLVLLHIVHDLAAHPGFYHSGNKDHIQPMQDVAQDMMGQFLEQMKSQHPGLAELDAAAIRLVPGLPPTRIVEVTALLNASLIVMGGHGWSGHSRKRLGSVVERTAELSQVPVVIVKSGDDGAVSEKELKKRKKREKKERKMLKNILGLSGQGKAGESIDD